MRRFSLRRAVMNPINDTTFQEDIDSIKSRIVDAEAERTGWPTGCGLAEFASRHGVAARLLCSVNSARNAGWAMAINSRARCFADLPRNWATPYSVTT